MRRIKLAATCVALLAVCTGRLSHAAPITILDFTNSLPTFATDFSNLSNDNSLEIRWGSIANVGGTDVDLVATVNGGAYAANNIEPGAGFPSGLDSRVYQNGLSGSPTANYRYGRINLRADYSATFDFMLVDPNDDDWPRGTPGQPRKLWEPVNAVIRHWGEHAKGHFVCERENPQGAYEIANSHGDRPSIPIADWSRTLRAHVERKWLLWRMAPDAA